MDENLTKSANGKPGAQLERASINLYDLMDETVKFFSYTAAGRFVSIMSYVDKSVRKRSLTYAFFTYMLLPSCAKYNF